MNFQFSIYRISILLLLSCNAVAQHGNPDVKIVGAMRNVMWKGQLYGNLYLDTISNKEHLYGLGPVEYLRGEILIMDGKSFVSTVLTDSTMKVEETYNIKAPFLGYSNIPKWTEQALPDTIVTIQQLENYLDQISGSSPNPFMFKLQGTVEYAAIHIVNLPRGYTVTSPDDVHKEHMLYKLTHEESEIVGFFSTEHQGIFTHHDTYLHMHLITADKAMMGHLDEVLFERGTMKLYLPE